MQVQSITCLASSSRSAFLTSLSPFAAPFSTAPRRAKSFGLRSGPIEQPQPDRSYARTPIPDERGERGTARLARRGEISEGGAERSSSSQWHSSAKRDERYRPEWERRNDGGHGGFERRPRYPVESGRGMGSQGRREGPPRYGGGEPGPSYSNWRPRQHGGGRQPNPTPEPTFTNTSAPSPLPSLPAPPPDPAVWAPTKKLTFAAMSALRALHQSDPKLHHRAALGEKFGISYDAVGRILRSKYEHKERAVKEGIVGDRYTERPEDLSPLPAIQKALGRRR